MSSETVITLVGNLVDDPELRYIQGGQALARFRVASTPRYRDRHTNEWKDAESLIVTCSVWRQAAENVVASLTRGMRVIVQGRLRQRSFEADDGTRRTVYEIEADDVGPSLRTASVKVTKNKPPNTPTNTPANTPTLTGFDDLDARSPAGSPAGEHAYAVPRTDDAIPF